MYRSLRLRTYLIVLVLMAAIPLVMTAVWLANGQLTRATSSLESTVLKQNTEHLQDRLDMALQEQLRDLSAYAVSVSAVHGNDAAMQMLGNKIRKGLTEFSWMGLTDANGTLRFTTGGLLEGLSVKERGWFNGAHQGMYLGDLHSAIMLAPFLKRNVDGTPIRLIDIALPVRDEQGNLLGVIAGHLSDEWLQRQLITARKRLNLDADVDVAIIDPQGRILFGDVNLEVQHALLQAGKDRTLNNNATVVSHLPGDDGGWTQVISAPVPDSMVQSLHWRVVSSTPHTQRAYAVQQAITHISVGGLLFIVALLGMVGGLLTIAFKPIQSFMQQVQALEVSKQPIDALSDRMPREFVFFQNRLNALIKGLREREEKLSHTLNTLSESFIGVSGTFPGVLYSQTVENDQLKYTYISETVKQYFGVSAADILSDGLSLFRHIHPEDVGTLREVMRNSLQESSAMQVAFRVKGYDNRWRWMQSIATPRKNESGRVFWDGVTIDITSVKDAEERATEALELMQAAKQEADEARKHAERANEAKARFLATMSHELRTPLNGIVGFARLLEEGVEPHERTEFAHHIREMGEMLRAILNDVLDMAKVESGRMQLERQTFSLSNVLQGIKPVFEVQLREKNVQFKFEYPAHMPMVQGDPIRLRQIIHNLLSNAVKFTSTGSVSFKVDAVEHANSLQLGIVVRDTGIGIPDAAKSRLFGRFEQADESISRRFGGSGLGLSIARSLLELMGGSIRFSSKEGQGTEFVIELSLAKAQEKTPDPLRGIVHSHTRTLSILVVDDFPLNRKLIETALKKFGHHIAQADNGQVALDMAASQAFDLILMDVDMHVMDGLTATRLIRELPQGHTPLIVAMSGNAFEEDVAAALEAGMDGHMSKPVSFEKLYEWIERAARHGADAGHLLTTHEKT